MRPKTLGRGWLHPLTLLALVGLIAAACAPAAPPPTPAPKAEAQATPAPAKPVSTGTFTMRAAFNFGANYLPYWIAVEKGYFKEEGVPNVQVYEGSGSGTLTKTVGAGADSFGGGVDIGTTMNAFAEGVPVKVVATLLQRTPIVLAYYKDSGIKTPKDLKGKSIMAAQGSAEARMTPVFLKANGVEPADVKLVEVGSQVKVTLFKAHQADAMVGFMTGEVQIFKDPAFGLFLFTDYGVNFAGSGIITNEKMINEQPNVIRGVIKAALRGNQFMIDHPAEAADIGIKYFPATSKDILAQQIPEVVKFIQSDDTKKFGLGYLNKDTFVKTQELSLQVGIMTKRVDDVTKFYDDRFLK